jgi:transaldolase
LDINVQAQAYYQLHGYQTKVKAAGFMNADEILPLSGVASITIPPEVLEVLARREEEVDKLQEISLFSKGPTTDEHLTKVSYVNSEEKYREAFSKRDGGKGESRTKHAIEIFSGYQKKAENFILGLQL